MRHSMWLLAVTTVLALGAVSPAAFATNSQQDKMTSCNADAKTKGLQGDERKAFMKSCLSAGSSSQSSSVNSQQQKMKSCSADAKSKGLKGDERKKFMGDCLKGAAS